MPGSLHPFVVHFAIALLLMGPAFDLAGLLLRREALLLAGRWNTLVGAAFVLVGALSGYSAQGALGPHSAAGASLLSLHSALGYLALAVWLPTALWRGLSKLALPLRLRTIYLALAFSSAALMLVQAALGSALVYWHGVGLSAEARAEPALKSAKDKRESPATTQAPSR
ncbi:MAG: DUF2231 domain-containing protein [Deltaproteobacteria bacterium]|nr:DUF2231 domain-containing protein [Deltaproteobacteria bacterium]